MRDYAWRRLAAVAAAFASMAVAGGEPEAGNRVQTKTGIVRKVDSVARTIVVMVAREMTFAVAADTQIAEDGTPRTLADVKVGATIRVVYSLTPERARVASEITLLPAATAPTGGGAGASPQPALRPGQSFSLQFPDLPPTFDELVESKGIKPQMTVFLPRNYALDRKHPLLVFLNGGTGGRGDNPGIARALVDDTDFVCLSVPLFIKDRKANSGVIQDEDGRYMWPHLRTMLERLLQVVPNIDQDHMIMGGSSNGAHAVQGLINESDGEIARRFSAFFIIEGGPRAQRWHLLEGRPYLMVISQGRSLDVMKLYCASAREAGVNATLICEDIGHHGIPEQAYPAMRAWLRGPAMAVVPAAPGPVAAREPAGKEGAAPKQSAGPVAATVTLATFDELMKSADVPEQIPGQGPMTFFAPTDAAFAAMPEAKLEALKKAPKAIREFLLNLMVRKDISPGALPFAGRITTLGGGVLTASPAVASERDTGPLGLAMVNDAKAIKRVPVSKGRRIYALDKVVFAEKPATSEQGAATDTSAAGPAR